MVGVAQLVERRSVAPNVAGSIPVSHPKHSALGYFSLKITRFPHNVSPVPIIIDR